MTSADTPTAVTLASDAPAAPAAARYCRIELVGGVPGSGSATGTVYFDMVAVNMTLASNLIQRRMLREATASAAVAARDLPSGSSGTGVGTPYYKTVGYGRPTRGGTYKVWATLYNDDVNHNGYFRVRVNGATALQLNNHGVTPATKTGTFACAAGDSVIFDVGTDNGGYAGHCSKASHGEDEPMGDFGIYY